MRAGSETGVTLRQSSRETQTDRLIDGTEVGEYVVEKFHSQGGFARIYRARRRSDGQAVALKVLHDDLVSSDGMLRRFHRELDMIRRLRHPNIVAVFGSGEVLPGQPFIAMEWLEGRTLQEELAARGPFLVREVLQILDGLCSALDEAHRQGVIHRDLKPSNVILQSAGPNRQQEVKLLDFGVAKVLEDEGSPGAGLTSTGAMIGTPGYMAPEQLLSQPLDRRADVYSLGALLFELLTGRPPFVGTTMVQVVSQHLMTPPPRASRVAAVPPAVDDVIQRCLGKRPEDRYATAREVLDALRLAACAETRRTGEPSVAGLHLSLRPLDPAALGDDTLDEIDRAMESAEQACKSAGLAITFQSGRSLVAVVESGGPAGRQELADLALALRDRPGTDGRVRIALTLHAATCVTRLESEIVLLGSWGAARDDNAVVASHDFASGLPDGLLLAPLDDLRSVLVGRA